jgi:hypothetical protein
MSKTWSSLFLVSQNIALKKGLSKLTFCFLIEAIVYVYVSYASEPIIYGFNARIVWHNQFKVFIMPFSIKGTAFWAAMSFFFLFGQIYRLYF